MKSTAPATQTTATTAKASPENTPRSNASKPPYVLKVKTEEGKFVRIGGMWKTDSGDGFKITLDEGIEITSTKTDRFKAFVFPNDYEEKFGKDGKGK